LQKCCEGEEGDDEDRKPVCTYFGKGSGKYNLCRLSFNEFKNFKSATNKTLEYDMPRVKLFVSGLIPGVETEVG